MTSPNRNDPCPCGSGKKYKKCCLINSASVQHFDLPTVQSNLPYARPAPANRQREPLTPKGVSGYNASNVSPPSELLMKAVTLHQAGMLDEAEAAYLALLKALPNDSDALHYLGLIAFQRHHYPNAVNLIEAAININRRIPAFHCNLGNAYKALGQFDSAVSAFLEAIRLDPYFQAAHSNLGNTYKDQGRLDEAIACYHKALALRPDFAEAHSNLASALRDQGKLDDAVSSYRMALSLKPDFADAYSNLGVVLREQGKLDEAVTHFHQALSFNPNHAETFSNLGIALKEQGKLHEAVTQYRQALELRPDFAEAHYNLGNALQDQGYISAAVECYQNALSLRHKYADAYNNLLYLHAFSRDISPEAELELAANWENTMLSEEERMAARNRAQSFEPAPRIGRKLRLGIVSAELGQHAVAEFLEPILEQLDRTRFHITLYPTAIRSDPRAEKLKRLADVYKSVVQLSDYDAANLIMSDRIDILIDTTGHMGNCRLGIFAHRAAPVQCHYIGYHGTTGLTEMDWFIADEVLLPAAYDSHFRENIWRLPRLRMAYKGDASLSPCNWQPDAGGTIWLGSFNNLTKVREEALGLWARVMNALPESKLLLKDRKADEPAVQERIRSELGRHGISADRIELLGSTPDWNSHMALYNRLDIALDTIPLNSETTAFDALWMGVPLVALEGDWYGGRMASTLLKAFGKSEWIAQDNDQYVEIVTALARDIEGRKSLRLAQRALMADSPLCDAKELTRHLEDAFERMYSLNSQFRSGTG